MIFVIVNDIKTNGFKEISNSLKYITLLSELSLNCIEFKIIIL